MKAHYYASKAKKILVIEHAPHHGVSTKQTLNVSGKREARKIATERGATCWNF